MSVSTVHVKFGKRIQELRKQKGLTQEDLTDLISVDRSYMGFVERGEKNPTVKTLARVAKALKVSLFELFRSV